MIRRGLTLLAALVCLSIARPTAPACAQALAPPEITKVRVGFNGIYKVGYWTPIEITLLGGSDSLNGQLEVTVPDGDGVPTRVIHVVALPAGQAIRSLMYIKVGQVMADIHVAFRVKSRVVTDVTIGPGGDSEAKSLTSSQELIVTMGSPAAVEIEQTETREVDKKTQIVRITDAAQMPTRWYGYEGVDWLVLSGSEPEIYRQLSTNSARIDALDEWIRMGGKLLFYVGRNAPEILSPEAPLAIFAPGSFQGLLPLRQLSALENYVESTERVEPAAGSSAASLDAARLVDVKGAIEAHEGGQARDLPLVVRTSHGFGQIVFVAIDLDRPPLKTWSGRKQLFRLLLGRPAVARELAPNSQGQVTNFGHEDLAGQLRSGLEQFTGVRLVPFSFVALLIMIYILFIGPIDYFLVKRVLKRMELTWITFPAMVIGFSLGAYLLAYWLKGDQLHINRVEVVDFEPATGLVRGTIWSNIFSPRIDAFNLSLEPAKVGGTSESDPQVLLSWLGLPGSSFGGMNPRARNAPLFSRPYFFSSKLDAISQMPIAVWSTKAISGRWSYGGNAKRDSAKGSASPQVVIESDLAAGADKALSGTLRSNLEVPLYGAVVLYDSWAYPLERLEPGQSAKINQLNAVTIETRFRQFRNDGTNAATDLPVDFAPGGLRGVLETMMFNEALGGEAFTRLPNDYQRFIDLSGQLKTGQAILFGTVDAPGAKLLRDGEPLDDPEGTRITYYRFVLDVGQADR